MFDRHKLTLNEHGIWSRERGYVLSYPDTGHAQCLDVEDNSFWFRHRNDCIAAAIRRFPPQGGRTIVDVGGGNGFVAKRLHDEGFHVIVVEPGPVGAWNAKTKRLLPEVICTTLEDAGFEPRSLPAVGLFDVLEHVEDDQALAKEVHSVLAPGGLLYGTVPAHGWLWSLSDASAGHFRRYNDTMLREMLRPRFEILYFSYFFELLVVPMFLLRTIPFRIGLTRRRSMMSTDAEHGTKHGVISNTLMYLLRRELSRISRGQQMWSGTSCLFVAKKACE